MISNSTFRGAKLTGLNKVNLSDDAVLTDAIVSDTTFTQITEAQLSSTASYKERDLRGIQFQRDFFADRIELAGWNFHGQDLRGAQFGSIATGVSNRVDLGDADLRGANLKHAVVRTEDFDLLQLDATTTYDQWTIFREGQDAHEVDPADYGLTFQRALAGDFDGDGEFNAKDVEDLQANIRTRHVGVSSTGWFPKPSPLQRFDLVEDGFLTDADITHWLEQTGTSVGDANVDGVVDFADFLLLSAGFGGSGGWGDGDFDGDGELAFSDFLLLADNFGSDVAIADASVAVPEPCGLMMLEIALLVLLTTWNRNDRYC